MQARVIGSKFSFWLLQKDARIRVFQGDENQFWKTSF